MPGSTQSGTFGLYMSRKQVIVVGGGASGMMAAGRAAEVGADVILLEKTARTGTKLALTGHGRCNLSRAEDLEDFLEHYFAGGKFLRQAFSRFFGPDLVAFFGERGVEVTQQPDGRIFPASERAGDIVHAFRTWLQKLKVTIVNDITIRRLAIAEGIVQGLETQTDLVGADAVIIATGGCSYPVTGSTGDGYRLAERYGHRVIPVRPSLVPLVTSGRGAKRLQGVSLQDITVTAISGGKTIDSRRGDMLFTHFGLSGPAVLNLSRAVVQALTPKQPVEVSIDLRPDQTPEQLDDELRQRFTAEGSRQLQTVLREMMPRKLVDFALGRTDLNGEQPSSQVSAADRRQLRDWMKDFRFTVIGDRSFDDAIVTAGGVDTKEIDPRTMASRKVKGLYFCGEVLDIDGETGGYNLQAAFSTGWLAGTSAGQR